jgi:hypothetical protein
MVVVCISCTNRLCYDLLGGEKMITRKIIKRSNFKAFEEYAISRGMLHYYLLSGVFYAVDLNVDSEGDCRIEASFNEVSGTLKQCLGTQRESYIRSRYLLSFSE